jgi:hypothetical protein
MGGGWEMDGDGTMTMKDMLGRDEAFRFKNGQLTVTLNDGTVLHCPEGDK